MTAPRRGAARRWSTDLAMGARFAVTGGREGWIRTALTAVSVGLGVCVLLLAAAVPHAMNSALDRGKARTATPVSGHPARSDHSLLMTPVDSAYRGTSLTGRVIRSEGPHAPVPPGLSRLPDPGELAVSPALADLLASPDGALLKDRFPHRRITARIGDAGLAHPGELLYYEGSDALREPGDGVFRVTGFGDTGNAFRLSPLAALALMVGCVALLAPVAVFTATAVRFGGERRDRRLAALRLVGADRATTRRIAAGEALAGALLGLLTGAALFLAVRLPISGVSLFGLGFFPSDVVPDTALATLIALAVPAVSTGVTLLTMRRVTVEPLGVTRTAPPLHRRLWWRLLLPAAGVALLLPQATGGLRSGDAASAQLIGGTTLLLLGIAAVLPWLLDTAVARLGRGSRSSQSWHLAVRRLQLNGTSASRSVSGITVAVAGALAVQLLLAGVQTQPSGLTDPHTPWTTAGATDGAVPATAAHRMFGLLGGAAGVRESHGQISGYADTARHQRALADGTAHDADDPEPYAVTVADCAALRQLARIGSCSDGDVFLSRAPAGEPEAGILLPHPGERLALDPSGSRDAERTPATWTVPATARPATARGNLPYTHDGSGVLATPEALDAGQLRRPSVSVLLRLDPAAPDAVEHVRNAAARVDPRTYVLSDEGDSADEMLSLSRGGLTAGPVAVLLLIGCGLLITVLEQLRERARLLSALEALGTPRRVLGRSVMWQTALPVALGLALALGCGLGLGSLLLHMVGKPLQIDWTAVLALTGTAGAVILGVTALSLPLLWRLMRPDGLRTE
ncbi:FtsX-like permease family protein [Streptomyces sp. NPDC091266]|uniref:FtsX-like permease family protein n=1 Tax=Streptomyces sp. NPDC091266 TaxID=3365978 RepID=UPI0038041533